MKLIRLIVVVLQVTSIILYPEMISDVLGVESVAPHAVASHDHHGHAHGNQGHSSETRLLAGHNDETNNDQDPVVPTDNVDDDPCCVVIGGMCVTVLPTAIDLSIPRNDRNFDLVLAPDPKEVRTFSIFHPPKSHS